MCFTLPVVSPTTDLMLVAGPSEVSASKCELASRGALPSNESVHPTPDPERLASVDSALAVRPDRSALQPMDVTVKMKMTTQTDCECTHTEVMQ